MHFGLPDRPLRIGFVSTRIRGTDGVSLEIEKWTRVLQRMGHECFFIAGASDRAPERSQVIPEAHFHHPVIQEINRQCFGHERRNPTVTSEIHEMTWVIKEKLHSAIRRFEIDVLLAENCLTIPMNLPLGLAVVEVVMETGLGCIAHHHDFVWERERFLVNAVGDCLLTAFPPGLPQIDHVVINSQAAREFSRRTGLPCRVIPNVMDFDHPPPQQPDPYARDLRETIGLEPGEHLILQPTRVVQRKGIEDSIELVRRLDGLPCKLVITHASGDEGDEYAERLRRFAALLGVELIFAEPWISDRRGTSPEGRKQYTAWDAYQQADFVTYPSTYEGFGNAFLETVYYRKPILCNRYGIYRTDIEPCGFRVVMMDGFLTDRVVDEVRRLLLDPDERGRMVDHNYEVGARFFSFHRVEDELRAILAKPTVAPSE
jgi:mannosylglucosylglycerate synthase